MDPFQQLPPPVGELASTLAATNQVVNATTGINVATSDQAASTRIKGPPATHLRCIQLSKLRVEARSRGLPKVSSIVYCCVATLVTGGKVTLNEYIGKDY